MKDIELLEFLNTLSALRKVAEEYPGKTIENIIVQLEARLKEIGNSAAKQ
ncbi:hypothetical protein [Ruminococcus sp.]